jgi:hypothetical protein
MLASVAYNVWKLIPNFQLAVRDQRVFVAFVLFNLACNLLGAIALLYRRKIGLYLLAAGFIDGVLWEGWPIVDNYLNRHFLYVPITLLSFTVPFVIILYCSYLSKKRVLV